MQLEVTGFESLSYQYLLHMVHAVSKLFSKNFSLNLEWASTSRGKAAQVAVGTEGVIVLDFFRLAVLK